MTVASRQLAPSATAVIATIGLALTMALRIALIESGFNQVFIALMFATGLFALAATVGWRAQPLSKSNVLIGVFGAAFLCLPPLLTHLLLHVPLRPTASAELPVWIVGVTAVAVSEEILLRGVLFASIGQLWSSSTAIIVTSIIFALLHIPLYGSAIFPLDLAAGLWLGVLRLYSGGVTAPAFAHSLADVAAWWLR